MLKHNNEFILYKNPKITHIPLGYKTCCELESLELARLSRDWRHEGGQNKKIWQNEV